MHRDLRELVNCAAGQYGNKPAFRELNAKREVAEHTFNQLKSDIDALGTKLLDMGLKGKHIALIGESSYNYVVCYLATINGVGVIVPIDKDLTNDDIIKLLYKSDAEAIFFQNHLRKVCPIF